MASRPAVRRIASDVGSPLIWLGSIVVSLGTVLGLGVPVLWLLAMHTLPLPPDTGDATANAGGAMFYLIVTTLALVLPAGALLIGAGYSLGRYGGRLRIDALRSSLPAAGHVLVGAVGAAVLFRVIGGAIHPLRIVFLDAVDSPLGHSAAWRLSTALWFVLAGTVAFAGPSLLVANRERPRGCILGLLGGLVGTIGLLCGLLVGAALLGGPHYWAVVLGFLVVPGTFVVVLRPFEDAPGTTLVFAGGVTLVLCLLLLIGEALRAGAR